MTAIWSEGAEDWELLVPTGFPDERTLQELVATAPNLLPLSGTPRVVVLGREVLLGSGYVDVLAIEPSGRPVVVEVKLCNNTESRRAVVAQVLGLMGELRVKRGRGLPVAQRAELVRGRRDHGLVQWGAEVRSRNGRDQVEIARYRRWSGRGGLYADLVYVSGLRPRRADLPRHSGELLCIAV